VIMVSAPGYPASGSDEHTTGVPEPELSLSLAMSNGHDLATMVNVVTVPVPATRIAGLCYRAVVTWRHGPAFLRRLARRRRATPSPAPRQLRPVVVPVSLDDLRGPAAGVVELPVRLYWSGSRRFDLADLNQAADMCEAVLDVATTVEDLVSYLNADLLIRVWPALGLTRAKQSAWESQFPVLRRQRLAAAA